MDLLRRRDVLGQDTVHGHLVVVVLLAWQEEESTRDTGGEVVDRADNDPDLSEESGVDHLKGPVDVPVRAVLHHLQPRLTGKSPDLLFTARKFLFHDTERLLVHCDSHLLRDLHLLPGVGDGRVLCHLHPVPLDAHGDSFGAGDKW